MRGGSMAARKRRARKQRQSRTPPSSLHPKVQLEDEPHMLLTGTHANVLCELQCKYTGLFELSAKHDHKLMDSISQTVFERLVVLNKDKQSQYALGLAYRVAHPHSDDFQMILSNLHRIEDELQCPRTQLTEADLMVLPMVPQAFRNVASADLNSSIEKCLTPISYKVLQYLDNLQTVIPKTTEEKIATVKIREQLKRQAPYITQIFREIAQKHMMITLANQNKMRIYWEPFMPQQYVYASLLRSLGAHHVARSKFSHNCLLLSIEPNKYGMFLQADGTKLGGAKLVCRRSNVPLYQIPSSMIQQIKAAYGKAGEADTVYEEEQDDDDDDATEEEMH